MSQASRGELAGIKVSNPDRVIDKASGARKSTWSA